MPKISVIIPVYKYEEYLPQCLDSLVKQTLDDMEFIWVDNGASDECRKIMAEYAVQRPNVKIIHLKENIGYCGAMNKGLEIAQGEYIGFCDSDDWLDADYYEKLYHKAQESGADIVYTCHKEEFNDHSKINYHRTSKRLLTETAEKIHALRMGAVWDKIFRREMIKNNGICFADIYHSYGGDNTFSLPAVIAAESLVLTDFPYYHYRHNANSVMHAIHSKDDCIACMRENTAYLLNKVKNLHLSYHEKYELAAFFSRSLMLANIVKSDMQYMALSVSFCADEEFSKIFGKYRNFLRPKFWQQLFSLQECFDKKILRIFGIKIKLKQQEHK